MMAQSAKKRRSPINARPPIYRSGNGSPRSITSCMMLMPYVAGRIKEKTFIGSHIKRRSRKKPLKKILASKSNMEN